MQRGSQKPAKLLQPLTGIVCGPSLDIKSDPPFPWLRARVHGVNGLDVQHLALLCEIKDVKDILLQEGKEGVIAGSYGVVHLQVHSLRALDQRLRWRRRWWVLWWRLWRRRRRW